MNYDYQTVLVKKEKLDEVIKNYECFGYTIQNTNQHYRYENILEVELCRKHFIDNKDELQFLQVNMECDINQKTKLEKNKHNNSTVFGLVFGLAGTGFVAGSVLSFVYLNLPLKIILGVLFSLIGLAILIIAPIVLTKIYKHENDYFEKNSNLYENSIKAFCQKAKNLIGAKDENN